LRCGGSVGTREPGRWHLAATNHVQHALPDRRILRRLGRVETFERDARGAEFLIVAGDAICLGKRPLRAQLQRCGDRQSKPYYPTQTPLPMHAKHSQTDGSLHPARGASIPLRTPVRVNIDSKLKTAVDNTTLSQGARVKFDSGASQTGSSEVRFSRELHGSSTEAGRPHRSGERRWRPYRRGRQVREK
jgi:hypothetical protein